MRYCFRPPQSFTFASSCSGIDHQVSGYLLVTKGSITTLVLKICNKIAFASTFILPQKETLWPVIQNVRCNSLAAATSYLYYVSNLFTALLRLLFNIPSRY